MISNAWIQYGSLGIVAVVVFAVFPKIFYRVIAVVEKNTESFIRLLGTIDRLDDSIKAMNGNQKLFTDSIQKNITDQSQIGKLQCETLSKLHKNIIIVKKTVKNCPVRKKRAKKGG